MTDEMKAHVREMEMVAKKTFDRVKKHLMADTELELAEVGEMIDIAKDAAKLMKYAVEIKCHFAEHPEKKI